MISAGSPMHRCGRPKWSATQWGIAPIAYTLMHAAKAAGRAKSTVLRAIQSGKLSATRDELTGSWLIEPAELHRVYPGAADIPSVQSAPAPVRSSNGVQHQSATAALQGRL